MSPIRNSRRYPRNVRFPSSKPVIIMAWRSDTVRLESSSVFDFSIRHHEHCYPSMIIAFEDSRRRRHFFEAKLPLANFFDSKTRWKIGVGKHLEILTFKNHLIEELFKLLLKIWVFKIRLPNLHIESVEKCTFWKILIVFWI